MFLYLYVYVRDGELGRRSWGIDGELWPWLSCFRGCGLAGPRGSKAQRMGKEDAAGVEGRRWSDAVGKGRSWFPPRWDAVKGQGQTWRIWVPAPSKEHLGEGVGGGGTRWVSQRAGELGTWQSGDSGEMMLMSTWSVPNGILSEFV